MSIKYKPLGSIASAARGILITSGTNATPIVATVTAGHRQRNGDRIGIAGVTGLTGMNGDWTLAAVGATAATLSGSAGNGAFGGTAIVAALCDLTPFQARHSAFALTQATPGQAAFVGTLVIEYADRIKADLSNFQYTNSAGVDVDGFNSALLSGEQAIPAASAGQGGFGVEVSLARYMTARASAYTSGGVAVGLLA